jgi:hypothetical protein
MYETIVSDEVRGLSTHVIEPQGLQPDVHAVTVSQYGVALLGLESLARNFFSAPKSGTLSDSWETSETNK